jgi:4-amino-4-deoxy-L-arabinose transferase-like glycosyltransferase
MNRLVNSIFSKLTIIVFLFLLIPNVFQEGLFMDGLIYSTTGQNLSRGVGSFWSLSFTQTIMSNFEGHPPLAMYLQSLFFNAFGNYFFIEKLYALLTSIITVVFMVLIWRHFQQKQENKKLSWLPVLLWITIPVCFWAYQNNLLEATMGVFTIAASYALMLAMDKKGNLRLLLIILASGLISLGFLTKGFPAFFPLSVLAIHYLVYKRHSLLDFIKFTVLQLGALAVLLALIFHSPEARGFLYSYLDVQVVKSIQGDYMVDPRSFIVLRLLRELMAPFFLLLLIFLISWLNKKKAVFVYFRDGMFWKNFLFFLLIGVSASLPIMISLKQMGFYLLPALPFFVLAISTVLAPLIVDFCSKNLNAAAQRLSVPVFVIAVAAIFIHTFFNASNPSRDKELIADVRGLQAVIERNSTIGADPSLMLNWSLIGYLQRYHLVNLEDNNHPLKLTSKDHPITDEGYELKATFNTLLLYKAKE